MCRQSREINGKTIKTNKRVKWVHHIQNQLINSTGFLYIIMNLWLKKNYRLPKC